MIDVGTLDGRRAALHERPSAVARQTHPGDAGASDDDTLQPLTRVGGSVRGARVAVSAWH